MGSSCVNVWTVWSIENMRSVADPDFLLCVRIRGTLLNEFMWYGEVRGNILFKQFRQLLAYSFPFASYISRMYAIQLHVVNVDTAPYNMVCCFSAKYNTTWKHSVSRSAERTRNTFTQTLVGLWVYAVCRMRYNTIYSIRCRRVVSR